VDVCTEPDQCTDGACVGTTEVDCSLDEPCRIGLCDQESGGCVISVLANGTRCNDDDACTIGDRCGDGVCIGGPPPFCDDNDPCTNDGCSLADGCVHPAVGGFESVLCVFERRTIPFECRNPLPVPLAARLEQTERLLNVASVEQRTTTARRMLKRAGKVARKAQRVATRGRDGGLLPFHCGQAEDLYVAAEAEAFVKWHAGQLTWAQATREERIKLYGSPSLVRAFPTWNARSTFAHIKPVSHGPTSPAG